MIKENNIETAPMFVACQTLHPCLHMRGSPICVAVCRNNSVNGLIAQSYAAHVKDVSNTAPIIKNSNVPKTCQRPMSVTAVQNFMAAAWTGTAMKLNIPKINTVNFL